MAKQINNIHDKFIKELLSQKEIAIAFLEQNLPFDLLQAIDIQSIEYENTSFLNVKLEESFSDLVFRFKSGKSILKISLLLEHKSYIDANVAFQVLEYLALGYQKQLKSKKSIELIVPVIYYHGKDKWIYKDISIFFSEYSSILQKYIPNFQSEFIDLNDMTTDHILKLRNGLLRSALLIQRTYFDPNALNSNILSIIKSLEPYLEENFINIIFVYLLQNSNLDKNILNKAKLQLNENLNDKIMSIYDELIKEGIERGIEKGVEKGIEKGIEEGIEKTILNAFDKGYKMIDLVIISGMDEKKIETLIFKSGRKLG
jgi:predicted transposase/invertase (TIGR01784 family)